MEGVLLHSSEAISRLTIETITSGCAGIDASFTGDLNHTITSINEKRRTLCEGKQGDGHPVFGEGNDLDRGGGA